MILMFGTTLTFGCSSTSSGGDAPAKPSIAGTWRTDCQASTSNGQTSYLTYEISDRTSPPRFTVTAFGDAACTAPLFATGNASVRTVGASVAAPGAYELDIAFQKLFVTPLASGAIPILAGAGCGTDLAVGVEKDISATGCLFFKPIANCAGDYDIVKVSGDDLFNGVRGGDQCVPAGRPKELNAFSFHRVKGG